MARKKALVDEDQLAGIFPGLRRGPGGIPLPPKPGGTLPPAPTGTSTGTPGTHPTTEGQPGYVKPSAPKTGSSSSSSSSTASTYQQYLNQQKAMAAKAGRKTANRYITSAEALRSQANALLTLLGRRPGGGPNPFQVDGGGGGGGNGGGGSSTTTTTTTTGGSGQHGQQYGGWHSPFQGHGSGNVDPATNMPRTVGDRWAGEGRPGGTNEGGRPGQGQGDGQGRPGTEYGGWHGPQGHGQGGSGGGSGDGQGGDGTGGRNLKGKGLSGELKVNLRNVERAMHTADALLMDSYNERVGTLGKAAADNDMSANAQGFANLANRGRERANAVSEVIAQGAGESDALRAQQMSLRNWNANQGDINRSFFDTLTSVNSSLKDTTIDTRTARVQNAQGALDDKQQLWNSYFDAKAEALTQLGNTWGQMAEDYGLANEASDSKKALRRQKRLQAKSGRAFMRAAQVGSQSHKEQKVDKSLTDWQGAADFEGKLNNNQFSAAGTEMARPEGATLRRWNS